jgi:hypothetical protein
VAKGRSIIYPTLLLSAWVAGRAAYLTWDAQPDPEGGREIAIAKSKRQVPMGNAISATPRLLPAHQRIWPRQPKVMKRLGWLHRERPAIKWLHSESVPKQLRQAQIPASNLAETAARFAMTANPVADPVRETSTDAPRSKWFGHAYSFWRIGGNAESIVAPAGQYGGSQSGAILGYDLGHSPDKGLAVMVRTAATPAKGGEELAIGLRWQRAFALPLSLNAERRIRISASDDWAIYAAGGMDAKPLAAGFNLDAYGQAGWASGPTGGEFYDAQLRATRKLVRLGETMVNVGAGAWAGGQRRSGRLDIGPTVAAKFKIEGLPIDARIDWRQRIAGNARPGNGLAFTIATGF